MPSGSDNLYRVQLRFFTKKAYSKAWRALFPAEKSQFANYNAMLEKLLKGSLIRIGRSNIDPIPPIPDETTINPDHQEITTKLSISIPTLTWILFLDDFNNSPDPADTADIQNNLPAAPSASSVAAGGSAEQSMDTSELGSGTGGSGGGTNFIAGSSTSGIAKLMSNPR